MCMVCWEGEYTYVHTPGWPAEGLESKVLALKWQGVIILGYILLFQTKEVGFG